MEHKKGSMIYMLMILILCSSILVRNHRLFRTHVYLERAIYSMDVRVHDFNRELRVIEEYLRARFVSADDFLIYLKSGRKISTGVFTISYDSSYNEYGVDMILVVDNRQNYLRKVMAIVDNGQLKLISKGV
ncbi:MAG TPA: hypothetical protein DHM90_05675 [Clostridiaceae bacterium]|nr:hypothetical protein [Clostridiaceae bacterium]